MKKIKYIIRMIVFILLLPVLCIIAFEIFGIIVNHGATVFQKRELKKNLKQEFSDVRIIDDYSETGNTSGTGNHVDMLSVVVFQTNEEFMVVQDRLREIYDLDEWSFWIERIEELEQNHSEKGYTPSYYKHLDIPEDTSHCYLVFLCEAAPFKDNIEGH